MASSANREGRVVPLAPTEAELKSAIGKPYVPEIIKTQGEDWQQGRKSVAVGVVGALGSSYTVFEKSWICEDCETSNVATRPRCLKCRAKKPEHQKLPAEEEANEVTPHGEWKEIFDASARHLYYHNTATGETQWDRPLEMGPTPHGSGWFGRGVAGGDVSSYEANNRAYLERPARKQVDYIAAKHTILEGAYEYNIWWNKTVGGDRFEKEAAMREPAETRCVLGTDAGWTKADKTSRRGTTTANFCLFFARGGCAMGKDCRYFHRIPVQADLERFAKDEAHDIFGRQRHRDFRDDMMGVGAMTMPCRTLYVGSLVKTEYDSPKALEHSLWRHFGEWGELENVNLISRLSIAFIRYRYRSSAEFAKEAMDRNHLDHNENLNVRWAHEDPNPVSQDANHRADADALVEMLKTKNVETSGARDFDTPDNYAIHDSGSSYPDTNDQFPDRKRHRTDQWSVVKADDGSYYWWNKDTNDTSRDAPPAIAEAYADRALVALDAADQRISSSSSSSLDHHHLPPDWQATTDPASGAQYYFNTKTNATSWERPSGLDTITECGPR